MQMTKAVLTEDEMPRQWYNLAADLPTPMLPPLAPDGSAIKPEQLAAVFPMAILQQEMSQDRWIDIPEEVLSILCRWRPSPLHRAYALEKALGTPAKIFFKNESVSPAGSHKPNTAIAQAYYNKQEGITRICTETGAGQWGSALSFATALFGIECKVYMVKASYEQKPYRKFMMEAWGATCIPSPSDTTNAGREVLRKDPNCMGSLGIAISEAVEDAVTDKTGKSRYALGSVLNHVMLHQTIIGLETKKQLAKFGVKKPDVVVGCAGGGSNLAGLTFPFVADKVAGQDIEIIAVEPASCPSLTKGTFHYDLGDVAGMTPLLPMYTLGHDFMPPSIHAGGLRYHGMSPLVSQAVVEGLMRATSAHQLECFEAGVFFARNEGIIPAPESCHAICEAIKQAKKAKEEGKEKVIVFGLSGHGMLDLAGYHNYFEGKLADYELPDSEIARSVKTISKFPEAAMRKSGKFSK